MSTTRRIRAAAFIAIGIAVTASASATLDTRRHASRAGPRSRAEACSLLTWTTPASLITSPGHRAFTERPLVLSMNDGLLLLGSPAFALDSLGAPASATSPETSPFAAGVLRMRDGARLVPLPVGSRGMVEPQGAVLGDGAHVVWMEPDTSATGSRTTVRRPGDSTHVRAQTLWYARFQRGAWSPPESAASLPDPQWNRWQVGEMMTRGDALRLIIPLEGAADGAAAYLERENGKWTQSTIDPGRRSIAYARAHTHADGSLTLAFIAGGATSENRWNRVYVARSRDGLRWSTLEELSVPWNGPAYDLALAADGGALYLAWIERPIRPVSNPDLADSVRLSWKTQADSGWRRAPAFPVPHNSSGLRIAAASGSVHAVLREGTTDATLTTATWSAGVWRLAPRTTQRFPPAASLPSIARAGDSLVLVWGTARESAVGPLPQTVMATSPLACAGRVP